MHEETERRLAFGAVADEYDRVRPRYPDALVDAVVERAGIGRALEIGCGTGIATVPFAGRGMEITAVEPSAAMAAVARRRLAAFPRVRIEESEFEAWSAPPEPFDLVFCAQAWHWITPEARYGKAPSLLRDGGYLAVFANIVTSDLPEAQAAYARWAPERFTDRGPAPSVEERIARLLDPMRARFREVEVLRWPWSRRFTAAEYVRLIATYSDHATVPEPRRTALLDAIAEAIENAGGTVERRYFAVLFGARP